MMDMEQKLEPAAGIVEMLGGPSRVARIVGIHRTRVSAWQIARARGGTGGTIPYKHQPALIQYAKANDIPLKPEDFAVHVE